MIETITAILFLLAIVFVAMGPKPPDKKDKERDPPAAPPPADPGKQD